MKTNVDIKSFFMFFMAILCPKCVSNTHYMKNKNITYGYKGKRIKRFGIVMSSMPIRILMGVITLALCFNGLYDYVNVKRMPNISLTKCKLMVSKEKRI